jgi:hypothetical protein
MPEHNQEKSYPKRRYPVQTFITVLAIIFSKLAAVGLLAFVWPSMFIAIFTHFPRVIQHIVVTDLFLKGGIGLWVFVTISAILWYVRGKITE